MNPDNTQFKDAIAQAKDIVILLGADASADALGAALALYLALEAGQKRVTIASPSSTTVAMSQFIGVDKITSSLGNKNFVIALDYNEDAIEKVSYHIDNGKFNLVIEPRSNAPKLDKDKVTFGYSGFGADAIITVGVQALEELESFYTNNKAIFADKPVVVIDTRLTNRRFGKINIIKNMSSISELMYQLIKEIGLPVNADIATNLYNGIAESTDNFAKPTVQATTFETVADLLRNGAKRLWGKREDRKVENIGNLYKQQEEKPKQEVQSAGLESKEGAPPDWLKPKIYRGAGATS